MELFQNKNNLISFKTAIFIPFIETINRPIGIERNWKEKWNFYKIKIIYFLLKR